MTQNSLGQAIIVDLDGTLSDCEHRRHFVNGSQKRDWKSFYESLTEDPINTKVHYVVDAFDDTHAILLVSGRPEEYRQITLDWLKKFKVPFDRLYMRPTGNYEKDTVVKERIYRTEIEPKYKINLVLDDRASVVKMWRSIGLECWQVADGDF